jgi:sec-independent protein translocase protein TatC
MIIVVLAAVITPTGDVFNLTLFATPMIILFYLGVFVSYLLVLKRENKKFPWAKFLMWVVLVLGIIAIISWAAAQYFGYRFVMHSPFLVR